MGFFSRLFQISLVICFFSVAHAQQQDQKFWVVARGGLNLRGEPSLTGKKVTTIPEGEQVSFIEQKESIKVGKIQGYWWLVKWQGKTGFAFSGFLSPAKPIRIDFTRPLEGQFTAACLSLSADEPPKGCDGVCAEGSLLLETNGKYQTLPDVGGCNGGDYGAWKLKGDSIVLEIDDPKICFNTCEEYCAEGIPTDEPITNCGQFCPVKGKVPNACPKNMTREQYKSKFSKKYEIVLQLNKKGEVVVKKASKGQNSFSVGQNFGRLYEK
ncbi:MAG: SH3 domain-containing protein [Spirochaetota bacterium]